MNNELKYIDDLYKNTLGNLKQDAGKSVWIKLYWSLFWLKYRWYAASAMLIILLGFGSLLFYNPEIPVLKNSAENKTATVACNSTKVSLKSTKEITKNSVLPATAKSNSPSHPVANKSNKNTKLLATLTSTKTNQPVTGNSVSVTTTEKQKGNIDVLPPLFITNNSLGNNPDTLKLGDNLYNSNPQTVHHYKRFILNIYGGINYSASAIAGFSADYPDYRHNHETPASGWTTGIDLQYQVNNLTIGLGLNYSVYRQHRNYKFSRQVYNPDESYFDYDTTFIWIYDAPDLGKPMVTGIDSSQVKVYTHVTDDYSGYNNLRYIEIPVTAGYRFNTGNISFELRTGFTAGFLTGYYYAIPREDINCIEPTSITQVNKVMFSWLASASVYYRINYNTSIYVSPVYKQNLQSIFNNNFPVNERFKTFGVNLGISFEF